MQQVKSPMLRTARMELRDLLQNLAPVAANATANGGRQPAASLAISR